MPTFPLRTMRFSRAFACLAAATLAAVTFGACASEPAISPYVQSVAQARFDRDMAMRDPQRSILDPPVRRRFTGLRYFPVDTTMRFRLPLVRDDRTDTVHVPLHLGGTDPYVRVGTVAVPLDGGPYRLAVYRPVRGEPILWVPFRDATSGKESYGGGRYLYPETSGDTLVVDFNEAHNPNCDYNPTRYNCALPPSENRLPVRVAAGEQRSLLLEEGGVASAPATSGAASSGP